jgi:hypothetical protein
VGQAEFQVGELIIITLRAYFFTLSSNMRGMVLSLIGRPPLIEMAVFPVAAIIIDQLRIEFSCFQILPVYPGERCPVRPRSHKTPWVFFPYI